MTKLLFLALWLLKPFETVEKKHTDIKKKKCAGKQKQSPETHELQKLTTKL